jgi:hypothetical protein
MAINDNLWIVQGNSKRFAFELKDDYGKLVHDLDQATVLEFVLQDMETVQVLRLVGSDYIKIDQNLGDVEAKGWVTVHINTPDSENLEIGMYRYAIQARWNDGRTHEWTFPNVLHVLAGIIS